MTVVVSRNGRPIVQRTFRASEVGTLRLARKVAVRGGVKHPTAIYLHIRVDSPIDVTKLRWKPTPRLVYRSTRLSKRQFRVLKARGVDRIVLPYDVDLYPSDDMEAPQQAWIAPHAGRLTVTTQIGVRDPSANGVVNLTVKRRGALLAKAKIRVADGAATGAPAHADVRSGEAVYFDLSTLDPKLRAKLGDVVVDAAYAGESRITIPAAFHSAAGDAETGNGLFPQPYRGWGYAGYNGNGRRAGEPIDEQALVAPDHAHECSVEGIRAEAKDGFTRAGLGQRRARATP